METAPSLGMLTASLRYFCFLLELPKVMRPNPVPVPFCHPFNTEAHLKLLSVSFEMSDWGAQACLAVWGYSEGRSGCGLDSEGLGQ